jgi:dTDP-4-dehydrorhamnose 3,5-epimerase
MESFIQLGIMNLFVRSLPKFYDRRGFFQELHRENITNTFIPETVQDNLSFSKGPVLRGVHFQDNQWQILTVLSGSIVDVTIDIQRTSETFLKSERLELSDEGPNQLIIPPGVAHGFCTLSDEVLLLYKSSKYYGETREFGISWKSEQIFNLWPDKSWLMSERDLNFPTLNEFLAPV